MIGYDYLGMGSKFWPVAKSISLTPEGSAIGAFDHTFGDALPNIRKHLQSGKFPALRVHLWWADSHIIAPASVIKERAPKYERLAKDFPSVKIYLSHSCEYAERDVKVIQDRVNLIHKLAPSCTAVNCPMKSPTTADALREMHGSEVAGFQNDLVSFDGDDAADSDVNAWMNRNARATIRFLWSHRFNLRQQGPKIPPKERTAAPNDLYFKDIIALAKPIGPEPAKNFMGPVPHPIKNPILWKIMAEDKYGAKDPRANKPLLISKSTSKVMEVVASNGRVVAKLGYYGPYSVGGMHRHYSAYGEGTGHSASQIANRAIEASGSPYVWFRSSTQLYGPCNASFRTGYFHD